MPENVLIDICRKEQGQASWLHGRVGRLHLHGNYVGKGKGKPKGKKGMWMDRYASWKGKNKGKGKGKDGHLPVNAYSSEMFLGGLEVSEVMEAASVESAALHPQVGMLDCGATASAAPEAVVRALIASVLTQDRSAKIEFDQASRPYFRFGNGRWGQALCKVHICSSASGSPRNFSLFVLPNPAEYYQANFDKSTLVPVLVGKDYHGPLGVGMMIDFATGLAMNTQEPNPNIFSLSTSKKGHQRTRHSAVLNPRPVQLSRPSTRHSEICISHGMFSG